MAARDSTDRTSTKWVDILVERGHLRLFERRGQAFCGAEGAWAHMTRRRTFKTSFLSLYFLEVGKLFRRFVCVLLPSPPPRLPVFARPALTTFITLIILSEIAHPSSAFAAWISLFALHKLPLPLGSSRSYAHLLRFYGVAFDAELSFFWGSELGARAKEELISSSLFWYGVGVRVLKFGSGCTGGFFGVFVAVVAVVRFLGVRGKGFYQSILLTSARLYILERGASSSGVVLVLDEARGT